MVPLLQKMLGSCLPSILGHPFLPGLLTKIQAKEAKGKCGGRWGGVGVEHSPWQCDLFPGIY